MNHLAHLYLSRSSAKLMVGNFIADEVKGKKFLDYEAEISKGIMMHREIDTFTDSNDIVSHSKSFFRARYGLFSSVLIDVFYDHFLAKSWSHYSTEPLAVFADQAYSTLGKFLPVMPERSRMILTYMKKENWLLSYAALEGIQRIAENMARRIKNNPGIEHAHEEMHLHYRELQNDFDNYFPKLIAHISPFVHEPPA